MSVIRNIVIVIVCFSSISRSQSIFDNNQISVGLGYSLDHKNYFFPRFSGANKIPDYYHENWMQDTAIPGYSVWFNWSFTLLNKIPLSISYNRIGFEEQYDDPLMYWKIDPELSDIQTYFDNIFNGISINYAHAFLSKNKRHELQVECGFLLSSIFTTKVVYTEIIERDGEYFPVFPPLIKNTKRYAIGINTAFQYQYVLNSESVSIGLRLNKYFQLDKNLVAWNISPTVAYRF